MECPRGNGVFVCLFLLFFFFVCFLFFFQDKSLFGSAKIENYLLVKGPVDINPAHGPGLRSCAQFQHKKTCLFPWLWIQILEANFVKMWRTFTRRSYSEWWLKCHILTWQKKKNSYAIKYAEFMKDWYKSIHHHSWLMLCHLVCRICNGDFVDLSGKYQPFPVLPLTILWGQGHLPQNDPLLMKPNYL